MVERTDPPSPWSVALRLMARREMTPQELAAALSRRGYGEAAIAATLQRAQALGLLDETRAARLAASRLANRHGDRAIVHRLSARGVAEETIAATLTEVAQEQGDERQRAMRLWQRKFAAPPTDPRQWQRQARYLAARGFSWETIRALLDDPDLPGESRECF